MVKIGFAYIITLAIMNLLPQSIAAWAPFALCFLCLILIFLKPIAQKRNTLIVLVTCIISGIVYNVNSNTNIKPVEALNGQEANIIGIVDNIEYSSNSKIYYTIKITKFNGKKSRPFKTITSSHEPLEAEVGDKITGDVHFYSFTPNTYFNSKNYYKSKNIFIASFFKNPDLVVAKPNNLFNLKYFIINLRTKMLSQTHKIFSNEISSLINGVLLGEKHDLSYDLKKAFRRTGIYHLLAVSGIHLTILSTFVLSALKKLRLKGALPQIITSAFILLFMAIVNFSPSVVRSGIMIIIYLMGTVISKNANQLNSLAIAIFLICAFNPNYALDLGLWLSLLSCLGIILLSKNINKFLQNKFHLKKNKIKSLYYITSCIAVGVSSALMSLPLCLYIFKEISLIGIVANIVLSPIVSALLVFAFLTITLSHISAPVFIWRPIAFVCGVLAKFLISAVKELSSLPFAAFNVRYRIVIFWAIITICCLVTHLALKNHRQTAKIATLLSANICLGFLFVYQILQSQSTLVEFINCPGGIECIISKNYHQAAILSLNNEKYYRNHLETAIETQNIVNFDYLNVIKTSESLRNEAQNIINNQTPLAVATPDYKLKKPYHGDTQMLYFKTKICSTLWDDVIVENIKTEKNIYAKLTVNGTTFLIIPSGTDANDIPENFRKCNFLVSNILPMNYNLIEFDTMILSSANSEADKFKAKLSNIHKKVIYLADCGQIYTNINTQTPKTYKLQRSL